MAGSKSKPKAIEVAKKMGKKRPNSALTDGEEIVQAQEPKRRRGKNKNSCIPISRSSQGRY